MMGLKIRELYELTPRQFNNMLTGWYDTKQASERIEWERTRWLASLLINIQLPKGKQLKSAQDLAVFEWERDPEKEKIDKAEHERRKAIAMSWPNEITL